MDWQEFEYEYVGYPWFEPESRERTYKAMKVLCDCMPEKDKVRIPSLIVFAPAPAVWGEQHTLFHPACSEDGTTHMLYLSPELENRPQAYVNSTVAHEFAHAILNHDGTTLAEDPYQHEREADTLIATWGFRPTNSCRWMQKGKKKKLPRGHGHVSSRQEKKGTGGGAHPLDRRGPRPCRGVGRNT